MARYKIHLFDDCADCADNNYIGECIGECETEAGIEAIVDGEGQRIAVDTERGLYDCGNGWEPL